MRIRVNPVVLVIAALLICLAAIAIVTHAQSPPALAALPPPMPGAKP